MILKMRQDSQSGTKKFLFNANHAVTFDVMERQNHESEQSTIILHTFERVNGIRLAR